MRYLVLTDDWELRGNGEGNVNELQVQPAKKLMSLYEKLGIKGTFNVEVMQQLAFERYSSEVRIAKERDLWLSSVREMRDRGHDVQLHIHPQWFGAYREKGKWVLGSKWNIVDYSKAPRFTE